MRIVVVGGGIAGLAAAHRVTERAADAEVIVVEQAPVVGGKLRTMRLAGGMVESGAEAFLNADPRGGPSEAVALARAVGLGPDLRHPATAKAAVAISGELRDLPSGTLMGIPAGFDRVLDTAAAQPLLAPGADVSVGELVRARRGDEVVDRYVEPLLGGIYAGHADSLSLRMAIPNLALAAEAAYTLTDAVRAALAARRVEPGAPVFATIEGGMSRLVDALVGLVGDVRVGSPVRKLGRSAKGWRLTLGPTREVSTVDADGVVLAVPAAPAARLLSTVDNVPPLSLEYASVALVALALPALKLPELSGFLVPPTEGFAVKAVTFFDRKWAHLRRADGVTVLRASLGRAGAEAELLQRADAGLVALVRAELAQLLGLDALPAHLDAAVYRWGGALPQYRKGHLDRVAALRAGLARHPALAVAGAAYDGVGIPACVTSGRVAADAVLDELEG